MVTLLDVGNKKCIKNYRVSNYSCLYCDFLNRDNFFVKTKEGSLKLWNIEHDTCIVKWNVNNFIFIKPYRINNNQIVTPINHDGDIAIYDLKIEQENNSHNYFFFKPKKTNRCEAILNYDNSKGYNTNDNLCSINKMFTTYDEYNNKCEHLDPSYEQNNYNMTTKHNNNDDNCYGYNKNKLSKTNTQMYKEIIDINPIPYLGETYIMVGY
ncbi:conserved Plasmodium protein, unknown function [Plasmodium sp. DRC-Itaito]|nr:conserved Plasmodium protein, unknown function [Plasmodium sp. DRC-Itaito]